MVEEDGRVREGRIASTTRSPIPSPKRFNFIPSPSAQPATAFNDELARDEEELNEIARPAEPQSENEVARPTRPQSEDESDNLDNLDKSQLSHLAPLLKKAKGKRPTKTPDNIDA